MPIMHIVTFKFKPEFSDEALATMFTEEVRAKSRMPELIAHEFYGKNTALLREPEVNKGMNFVMILYFNSQVRESYENYYNIIWIAKYGVETSLIIDQVSCLHANDDEIDEPPRRSRPSLTCTTRMPSTT